MVPELRGKYVQLGCFRRGSTSFHSDLTWTGLSPSNHSWHQKTRDTRIPDGEDHTALCSVALTQYQSVADRRMDGRICSSTYCTRFAVQYKNQTSRSNVTQISSLLAGSITHIPTTLLISCFLVNNHNRNDASRLCWCGRLN